jgi:hypothetical protein
LLVERQVGKDLTVGGDHSGETDRGRLEQVPPLGDGLQPRGGELLSRYLARRVGRGVGRDEQGLATGEDSRTSPAGEERLEGDEHSEAPRWRGDLAAAVTGHGVEGDRGQVGEVGEERPVGHVLAKRYEVHLLEHGRGAPRRPDGDHLVAEVAAPGRLGHSGDEGRVQAAGDGDEQPALR